MSCMSVSWMPAPGLPFSLAEPLAAHKDLQSEGNEKPVIDLMRRNGITQYRIHLQQISQQKHFPCGWVRQLSWSGGLNQFWMTNHCTEQAAASPNAFCICTHFDYEWQTDKYNHRWGRPTAIHFDCWFSSQEACCIIWKCFNSKQALFIWDETFWNLYSVLFQHQKLNIVKAMLSQS